MLTFSTLLTQILNASGMSLTKASQYLEEKGINVPYSSLAAYKAFTSVPEYDRAVEILNGFDYPISSEELLEVIQYSKSELKDYKTDTRQYLNKGLRLNPKQFQEDMTADELERILEVRMNEIGEPNLNSYISKLIKNDLVSEGLIEGK